MLPRQELVPTWHSTSFWRGPEYQQNKADKFHSFFGVIYIIVNSRKYKGKALQEHILKDIVPRGFDARFEEIQGKHQQAIKEKDATTALLNDDLKNREYKNVGLQGDVRAKNQQIDSLQKRYQAIFHMKTKTME